MTARPEGASRRPLVTIVIPVRNEEKFLADVLDELLAQDYPADRMEILVCDGRSTDGTRRIVADFASRDPRVRLIDNPGIRSSAGRNAGFRAGRGEIFLVVDGHVRIGRRDLLRNITDAFHQTGADCLGRPQPLLPRPGRPWSQAIVHARTSRLGHSPSSLIFSDYEGWAPAASNGAAYRAHVFDIVGYVDEDLDACEDLDFNTRIDEAGLRCWTSPRFAIGYYARDSVPALFRQMWRYGLGRFRFLLRHPARLDPATLAPPLLVLLLAATPVVAAWIPGLLPLVLLPAGAWLLTILAASLVLAVRTGWRHFPRYLVIFPAIHLGLGLGFLAGAAGLVVTSRRCSAILRGTGNHRPGDRSGRGSP